MKLVVVMLDTFESEMAMVHLNQSRPFSRRVVQIDLTSEQIAALRPRHLGKSSGTDRYEEIERCWLEGRPEPKGGE